LLKLQPRERKNENISFSKGMHAAVASQAVISWSNFAAIHKIYFLQLEIFDFTFIFSLSFPPLFYAAAIKIFSHIFSSSHIGKCCS
jgi:hypothetical protein